MSRLSNCDCQLQTRVAIVGFFIQVARLSTSYLVEIVCCFNLVLKIGVPFWMVDVWTMTHAEVWYMTWIWMWTMQDTNANVDWDASLSVDRDQDASLNVNQQCGCLKVANDSKVCHNFSQVFKPQLQSNDNIQSMGRVRGSSLKPVGTLGGTYKGKSLKLFQITQSLNRHTRVFY